MSEPRPESRAPGSHSQALCALQEPVFGGELRITSKPWTGSSWGVRTPGEVGDSLWGAPSSSLSSHCYPRSDQKSPKSYGWGITNLFSLWAKQTIKPGPLGGCGSAPRLRWPLVTSIPWLSGRALKTHTTHSGFPWGKMITIYRVADN